MRLVERNIQDNGDLMRSWTCPECGHESQQIGWPAYCYCGFIQNEDRTPATPPGQCPYLGPPTGSHVKGCECGGKMPIYLCEIQATTVIRRPRMKGGVAEWDGGVCAECELRPRAR